MLCFLHELFPSVAGGATTNRRLQLSRAAQGVQQHCPLLCSTGCRYSCFIRIYLVSRFLGSEEVITGGYCPAGKEAFPASGLGLGLIPWVFVVTLGLSRGSVRSCESNQLAKVMSLSPNKRYDEYGAVLFFLCSGIVAAFGEEPLEHSWQENGRECVCGLR